MDIINHFPGYEYINNTNMYMDTDLGKGGYVYAEPGMYTDVALLDIASLHPSSIIALNKFGEYTPRYKEILDARIAIKHHDFEAAKKMLGGSLAKYLTNEEDADKLAQALKLIINSTYGFCAASFENPFSDSRDKNNIVALRGALFMRTLQDEVQKRGFTVAHVKTDSIKVPNATPEIIQFIMDFGKQYGYNFEHEATYEKMCLVNNAVYIAKYKDGKHAGEWTATGKQFQVPYVFKKLFSKESIEFADMCETKEVKTAIYLDMNEELLENEHDYRFVGKVGLFCPIKPGCGGGVLVREGRTSDGAKKYDSVTGTLKPDETPYRWLEAEFVKTMDKEDSVDRSYYDKLVDDAIETISQYGDFEWFVSDDTDANDTNKTNEPQEPIETPPWKTDCGKDTCEGCPHFTNDKYHIDCQLGYDIGDIKALNKKSKKKEK